MCATTINRPTSMLRAVFVDPRSLRSLPAWAWSGHGSLLPTGSGSLRSRILSEIRGL